MAIPGSTVYEVVGFQINKLTRRVVAQVQISVVDRSGTPQPTRVVGVKLPWSDSLFGSVASATAAAIAADPQLAGATPL